MSDRLEKPVFAPALPPPAPAPQPSPFARAWSKPVLGLLLLSWVVACGLCALRIDLKDGWRWLDSLVVTIATASTALALMERLPLQNVLWASALIGTLAVIVESLQAAARLPFGPHQYGDGPGPLAFSILSFWPIPLLWICLILNSRGVARLILRPWRADRHYGYWVIGFAGLLTVLLALGLEPYASKVRHYWHWQDSATRPAWYEAWYDVPWYSFLSWFGWSLGILVLTTPWLINKHPIRQPVSYQPVIVWGLFSLLFATANGVNGFWLAAAVGSIATAGVGALTYRGARWSPAS